MAEPKSVDNTEPGAPRLTREEMEAAALEGHRHRVRGSCDVFGEHHRNRHRRHRQRQHRPVADLVEAGELVGG